MEGCLNEVKTQLSSSEPLIGLDPLLNKTFFGTNKNQRDLVLLVKNLGDDIHVKSRTKWQNLQKNLTDEALSITAAPLWGYYCSQTTCQCVFRAVCLYGELSVQSETCQWEPGPSKVEVIKCSHSASTSENAGSSPVTSPALSLLALIFYR